MFSGGFSQYKFLNVTKPAESIPAGTFDEDAVE